MLTVTEPGPNAITTVESGVKIVRLTEYIGAARGTLSIVADPYSPAGTVIKDTQELAAPTTFASREASVGDTVSIPVADLNIGANAEYLGYLGVRVVGRPPVGTRAGEKWQYQLITPGPTIYYLQDAALEETFEIPREFYEGYTLIRAGTYSPGFLGATTNIKYRTLGITGGSMEFYLDLLYLIPVVLASTDDAGDFSGDAYAPLYLGTGGFVGPNLDNNTNNSISTAQSLMPDYYFDSVWDWDVSYDIQDAEYEKSIVDWNGIFFDEPNRESSWFYFRAGSRLVNAHTITTEDFTAYPGDTPLSQLEETADGYTIETGASTFGGVNTRRGPLGWITGWYMMNQSVQFLGPNAARPLPLTFQGEAYWSIGTYTTRPHPVSGAGVSDPRNVAPLLQGFDSIIEVHKVNILMAHAGGDVEMHFGCARWTAVNTAHIWWTTNTAKVTHHADGSHEIALESNVSSGLSYGITEFSPSVSVMGALAPGGSYWVKIEKRFNHYRARCWVDGDPEPSTWDVEGFAPAWVRRTATGLTGIPVLHPYAANWPADVVTVFEDPRFWHGGSNNSGSPTPWMHEVKLVCTTGFSTPDYEIQVDNVELSYDPDYPDNDGSYTGAYFHAEKYDGTVDWGTAYIPPGAWRVVVSDFAPHHFENDIHGGNVYVWKEAGGHPLQAAAWETFSFRRPRRAPRWGDIKFP